MTKLRRTHPRILVTVFLLVLVFPLSANQQILKEGIDNFRQSNFNQAIVRFREVLIDSEDPAIQAPAYFYLAKSAMALGRLNEAERNLEYYLQNYPNHDFSVEAHYQRGRLLYLKENYDGAIQSLSDFVDNYPDSPFVPNALYWSGESLYSLGRLSQSRQLFQTVVQDYPTSFRVEAARYRVAVIDLTEREEELLELLQWSHQEYLRAMDDFRRREEAYRDALVEYQERFQSAATEEFREEIIRLSTQVRTLQEQMRSKDAEIERLRQQVQSDSEN